MIKLVQVARAKNAERLRKKAEEKKQLERLKNERLEEKKRISLELERAE